MTCSRIRILATSTFGSPGVPSVDNYEAGHFIESVVIPKAAIKGQVINNSWFEDAIPDSTYDAYATTYNVLFVSTFVLSGLGTYLFVRELTGGLAGEVSDLGVA